MPLISFFLLNFAEYLVSLSKRYAMLYAIAFHTITVAKREITSN